jgi:hypothetical protein
MTTAYGPLVRVEQKDDAVVREYIVYDRFEGDALHCQQVNKQGQQGLIPLLPPPQQFDL